VSPLWRDRIAVFIGPASVHLTRYARGLRPRETNRYALECGDDTGWQSVVDTLRRALVTLAWQRADAHVAVSNQFVRFALVPDAGKLRNDAERSEAARHTLRSVYGEQAERWRVVLDHGGSRSAVAAGIERELVDGVVATLAAAKLRAVSVEPLLATALNLCRREVGSEPTWFAVTEPGRIALAYLDRGEWQTIRSRRLRATLDQELPQLLEQSRLADGAESTVNRVLVVSRDALPDLSNGPDWTIEPIRIDGLSIISAEKAQES